MTGTRPRSLFSVALAITVLAIVTSWAVAVAYAGAFSITGRVTDVAGNPIQDAHVNLYRNTLPDNPWFAADDAYTDAAGNYTITYSNGYWDSPDGNDIGYSGTYAMLFYPPGVGTDREFYRPQWWNGAQGYFAHPDVWQWSWQAANVATNLAVPVSGITMANVDAALVQYKGTIECTVRDGSTGLPVPNVGVALFHYDTITVSDTPYRENEVYTDANGRFTYAANPTLAAGSWWTLLFDAEGYAKAWLGGVRYRPGVDDASQSAHAEVTHLQVGCSATTALTVTLRVPCSLSRPVMSSTRPVHGRKLTFTARVTPAAAALSGTSRLYLWHRETKTVGGKKTPYWRLRSRLVMKGAASGRLTVSSKLGFAGRWRAQVVRSQSAGYTDSTSAVRTFAVK